jgi:hypothetical protein
MSKKTRNGLIGLIGTAIAVTSFTPAANAQETQKDETATVFPYDPYQRYGQNERRYDNDDRFGQVYQDDRYYDRRDRYDYDDRRQGETIILPGQDPYAGQCNVDTSDIHTWAFIERGSILTYDRSQNMYLFTPIAARSSVEYRIQNAEDILRPYRNNPGDLTYQSSMRIDTHPRLTQYAASLGRARPNYSTLSANYDDIINNLENCNTRRGNPRDEWRPRYRYD